MSATIDNQGDILSQNNSNQDPEPFDAARYDAMPYNRCGKRGLKLTALSLGGWQNSDRLDAAPWSGDVLQRIETILPSKGE